jgi:uracil-DNA glycosylase family 4
MRLRGCVTRVVGFEVYIDGKQDGNLQLEDADLSRPEFLAQIASEIVVCTKCRLFRDRKKAVPGEGSPRSRVMLIGEGPGRTEDVEGRPFVGQAGKFLDELLSEACLRRKDVFICNVVRCRPPRNRDPLPDEVQACTPYLDRQITVIKPRYIVTLGNHSTRYVFFKGAIPFRGITQARGKFYEATILNRQVTVYPTFHPAAALYNGSYKTRLIEDFGLLKVELARTKRG